MTCTCPTCGQSVNAGKSPVDALVDAPYAPTERLMVNTLAKRYPRHTGIQELEAIVFSGAKNGGPESGRQYIHVYLSKLRKSLKQYGWTINNSKCGRGINGLYRLEPYDG